MITKLSDTLLFLLNEDKGISVTIKFLIKIIMT